MKLHPRLTRATLELVTRFESFEAQTVATAAGGWTIGYGHTRSAREGTRISRADAEALLYYDLDAAAREVDAALFAPVRPCEFEALTAFCFSIGAEGFRRSSALARMNAGAPIEAADEIERWRHAALGAGQQVVDALVRRRAAEKAHFLGLPPGFAKSPSRIVRALPGEGGEAEAIEPPPIEAATSATRAAAESIQARLRELIPDVRSPSGPTADDPPPVDLTEESAPPAPRTADTPTLDTSPAEAPAAPQPPAPVAAANDYTPLPQRLPAPPLAPPLPNGWESPPPPIPAAPPPTPTTVPPEQPEPPVSQPPPAVRAQTRFRPTPRHLHLALAAIGACLFVAALVMILWGKPSLLNLALGVGGAVVLTPGVYGLLGPRPSET